MAIGLTVTKDVDRLSVDLRATGLTVGTKYDVHRMRLRYAGDNPDTGVPIYERYSPDRQSYWSSVAHRVGWTATATTMPFRDYECPVTPQQYFIVPSSLQSPYEYTNWANPYPVSRGYLSPTVVHFQKEWYWKPGHITVRSTHDLAKWLSLCVVQVDDLKYTARGTELKVMGTQYPVYVGDSRESRRGSIVLKVDSLGDFNELRNIVFPANGAIWPIEFHAGSEPTILLDNLRVIPLDITVEQATHTDPSLRFVRIDFVEIRPTNPLQQRIGDNENEIAWPKASFTMSDDTPSRGQVVTLTDTSTGQFDSWEWRVEGDCTMRAQDVGTTSWYKRQGPHKVRWCKRGTYMISLRVYGANTSALDGTSKGASTFIWYVDVT